MKTEDLFKLTTKELESFVKSKVNSVQDLIQHHNHWAINGPSEPESVCMELGLSDPENVYVYVDNDSKSNGRIKVEFTATISAELDIKARVEFWIKNTQKSIRIGTVEIGDNNSTSDKVEIFKKVHDIFDSRPNYNNLEYDYEVGEIDPDVPIVNYFNQIIDYRNSLQPAIDKAIEEYDNGNYENYFKKYSGKTFKRGHEVLTDSFSALVNYLTKNGLDKTEEYVCVMQFAMNRLPKYMEFKKQNDLEYRDGTDEYLERIGAKFALVKEYMTGDASYKEKVLSAKKELNEKMEALRKQVCTKHGVEEKDFILGLM